MRNSRYSAKLFFANQRNHGRDGQDTDINSVSPQFSREAQLAKEFIQAEDTSPKKLITATWDDAPHLSPEAKAELYKSIPPHEREARTEGRPMLGSGAVYPLAESDIVVDDFAIPDYWARAYGMDVGWQKTAAI